jgi:hypothetical protein
MLNICIGVPGLVRVDPAPGCPDPRALPRIQLSYPTYFRIALTGAIQAPPPTPGPHSP